MCAHERALLRSFVRLVSRTARFYATELTSGPRPLFARSPIDVVDADFSSQDLDRLFCSRSSRSQWLRSGLRKTSIWGLVCEKWSKSGAATFAIRSMIESLDTRTLGKGALPSRNSFHIEARCTSAL